MTLAVMFNHGCLLCTCHYLHNLWLVQPLFVTKKRHSESQTAEGLMRRNARTLRHQETGSYGLPPQAW